MQALFQGVANLLWGNPASPPSSPIEKEPRYGPFQTLEELTKEIEKIYKTVSEPEPTEERLIEGKSIKIPTIFCQDLERMQQNQSYFIEKKPVERGENWIERVLEQIFSLFDQDQDTFFLLLSLASQKMGTLLFHQIPSLCRDWDSNIYPLLNPDHQTTQIFIEKGMLTYHLSATIVRGMTPDSVIFEVHPPYECTLVGVVDFKEKTFVVRRVSS